MALLHTFPQPVPCPLGLLMLSVTKCLLQVLKKKTTKTKLDGCHICIYKYIYTRRATWTERKPNVRNTPRNYYKFWRLVGKSLMPHARSYYLQTDKRKSQSKHRPTLWLDIITDDLPEISFAKMEFSANLNWTLLKWETKKKNKEEKKLFFHLVNWTVAVAWPRSFVQGVTVMFVNPDWPQSRG